MKTTRAHEYSLGFTLLEVLIALAVLSIGLLGLAGLQVTGVKFNHQSSQRTQAVVLASDIIDRIRANLTGRDAYNNSASSLPTITSTQCITTACNASQLADYDIFKWKKNIEQLLVAGTGAITASAGAGRRIVTITWQEQDAPAQVLVVEADL